MSIFFIDEKQVIRPDDIGTVEEITRVANQEKASIKHLNLHAQFRCAGADGYINWVEDVLQLSPTGNFDGWDKKEFEFKIFDDPNELRRHINNKHQEGLSSRILAGYAWSWTAERHGNTNGQIDDVLIPEFDFAMLWNSRSVGTTWAIDEGGINQVGCVHIINKNVEIQYYRGHQFSSSLRSASKPSKPLIL